MTVMKKTVCLFLAVVTSLSLFGCNRAEDTEVSELLIFAETTEAATEAANEQEPTVIVEETVAETTAPLVEKTKPTAEAGGNTDKKTDADPKTESVHTHQWTSSVVSSTCTTQGYTLRTCLVCRQTTKDSFTAPKVHSWGNWKTVVSATTTSTGKSERKCDLCGKTESKTLDKLPVIHSHKYTDTVTSRATCTKTGVKTFVCTCGSKYTEAIQKIPHTYKDTVVKPTCTASGYTNHVCTICSTSYVDTKVPAAGHKWSEWKIAKAATETAEGTRERTCFACKAVEKGTVPKVTHAHKYISTVTTPTCTAEGFTTHTCTCGDTYVDSKVAAAGHTWSSWKTTVEATESNTGTKERTCVSCRTVETATIPMLTHTHSYSSVVTKPTCTEEGYTTYTCTCGESYVGNNTSATGHSWESWITTRPPPRHLTKAVQSERVKPAERRKAKPSTNCPPMNTVGVWCKANTKFANLQYVPIVMSICVNSTVLPIRTMHCGHISKSRAVIGTITPGPTTWNTFCSNQPTGNVQNAEKKSPLSINSFRVVGRKREEACQTVPG